MYDTVEHVLAADVAPAGTFTVGYSDKMLLETAE